MARRTDHNNIPHNRKPLSGATMRQLGWRRKRRKLRLFFRGLLGAVRQRTQAGGETV